MQFEKKNLPGQAELAIGQKSSRDVLLQRLATGSVLQTNDQVASMNRSRFGRSLFWLILFVCIFQVHGLSFELSRVASAQETAPAFPVNPAGMMIPAVPAAPAQVDPATAAPATAPPATPAETPATAAPAASPAPTADVTAIVSLETLNSLKSRLDSATGVTDAQKTQVNELIEKGRSALALEAQYTATMSEFQQRTTSLETERRTLQTEVETLTRTTVEPTRANIPFAELEQTLAKKQQDLVQAETELSQIDTRISNRSARLRTIKDRLAAIPTDVELIKNSAGAATPGDPPLVVEAKQQYYQAELKRLGTEPSSLQAESAFLTAQEAANILTLRRQVQVTKFNRLKDEVSRTQEQLTKARTITARSRLNTASTRMAITPYPQLKEIYEQNKASVELEIETREKQLDLTRHVTDIQKLRSSITQRRTELEQREKLLGSSTSFGLRLLKQRNLYANLDHLYHREIRERSPLSEHAHISLLETQEILNDFDNIGILVEDYVAKISSESSITDPPETLKSNVEMALADRKEDLTQLLNALESYTRTIDQLIQEQAEFIKQVSGFQEYINSRVMWVPTNKILSFNDVMAELPMVSQVFRKPFWSQALGILIQDVTSVPFLYFGFGLLWTFLILAQKSFRQNIKVAGQKASSRLNTDIRPTWSALGWTFLKSLVLPMPFLFLSWRGMQPDSLIHDFSRGLLSVSIWVWWLEAIRLVTRTGGLGPSHLQWPKRVNEVVNRQISYFLIVGTPLLLLSIVLSVMNSSADGSSSALQRVIGIIFFVMGSISLNLLTSRNNGVFQEWIEAHPGGWIDRLSFLWRMIFALMPLVLAGMIFFGYTYAVGRLSVRLTQTMIILTATIFGRALLFRWLTLRQRRLAIAHARGVRAALAAASPSQEEGPNPTVLEAQEAQTNLAEVSNQSKRLLNTMIVVLSVVWIFYQWRDILPAIQLLNKVPFLGFQLDQLIWALLQLVLFTTAARNIPGLIEMTLLERLPIDRSARYAIGAIIQYFIVIVAVSAIGQTLEIQWSTLQWLVAALTFSLGFGLQEIFANFVSGIIILFEQPVRVGDVVTLHNVTGTVSRIRIRSTSIIDSDRKEFIVPNKELITGRVLNWTLTDTVNRILMSFQTTLEADPDRVREILLKVASTQQHVLTDPSPSAIFNGFGDSSLKFDLAVYLATMDNRSETTHMIHARVLRAFQLADIDLAYPQRGMLLRSESHLEIDEVTAPTPTTSTPVASKDVQVKEAPVVPETPLPPVSPTPPQPEAPSLARLHEVAGKSARAGLPDQAAAQR